MWVKHKVKGVRNVSGNVGKAMIKGGDAVACDEKGNPIGGSKPKPPVKAVDKKKKES